MKINKKELDKYIESGEITKRKHPTLPLYVLNYSPEVTYSKAWNKITKMCRGLVIDNEYNIIARPFKKFFNLEELLADPKLDKIPNDKYFLTLEKLDGSLGIIFCYKGQWIITTRGSFESEQAQYAQKYLLPKYNLEGWDKGWTYLVEILYKDNRIVLNYGDREELVLLGIINTENGNELSDQITNHAAGLIGFTVAKSYEFETIENVLAYMKEHSYNNEEGYVLRWNNGFRVKVKYQEYVRLHRIITGLNERSIWEAMQDGTLSELEKEIPEEFIDFFDETKVKLLMEYSEIEMDAYSYYLSNYNKNISRKENAIVFNKYKYPGILFCMLDGKDYSKNIYKLIRP